jgi:hypothetical protein
MLSKDKKLQLWAALGPAMLCCILKLGVKGSRSIPSDSCQKNNSFIGLSLIGSVFQPFTELTLRS